ncbi:MAG: DUF1573 domain-containing protein [Bacteroidales bacterium]
MIQKMILSVLPALFFMHASAQDLKWDATSFRFPVSANQYKPLNNTFTFVNSGDSAINIVDIIPGSDVMVENYSRGTIPPGGKGFLKATVSPSSIRGPFTRTLTVMTDETRQPEYILTLEGEIRLIENDVAAKYPLSLGHMRYKPFYHLFFNLKVTETRTDTIFIYNGWDKEMTLNFDNLPGYIDIIPLPETLKPGKEGILLVTMDASIRGEYDMVFDKVLLKTNDALEPEKTLDIIAVIVDDFSKFENGDYSTAPVAKFSTLNYDFGTIKQSSIVRFTLELSNPGADTLFLRKSNSSCGCTVGKPEKSSLAPDESTNIQISFNTFGRHGRQSISVTFLTNDPKNPSQVFTLEGFVE